MLTAQVRCTLPAVCGFSGSEPLKLQLDQVGFKGCWGVKFFFLGLNSLPRGLGSTCVWHHMWQDVLGRGWQLQQGALCIHPALCAVCPQVQQLLSQAQGRPMAASVRNFFASKV